MSNISKHKAQFLNMLSPDLVWWTPGRAPTALASFVIQPKHDLFSHMCALYVVGRTVGTVCHKSLFPERDSEEMGSVVRKRETMSGNR